MTSKTADTIISELYKDPSISVEKRLEIIDSLRAISNSAPMVCKPTEQPYLPMDFRESEIKTLVFNKSQTVMDSNQRVVKIVKPLQVSLMLKMSGTQLARKAEEMGLVSVVRNKSQKHISGYTSESLVVYIMKHYATLGLGVSHE